MRTFLTLFFALLLGGFGYAQGYNPGYATSVTMVFHVVEGQFPREDRVSPPAYPPELRRASISGEVSFRLTVRTNGDVTDVIVEGSQPEFRRAAEEALASWRFLPRAEGASPDPLILTGKIRFSIVDE